MNTVLYLGAAQGIILGSALFFSRANRKANRILALFVLLLSFNCFFEAIESIRFYERFPILIRIRWGNTLLIGPLIFLYVRVLINHRFKILPHFIPFIIAKLALIPFYMLSAEEKVLSLNTGSSSTTVSIDWYSTYFFPVISLFSLIHILFYLWQIAKDLKMYDQQLFRWFSNVENIHLNWLKHSVWGLALLTSLLFVSLLGELLLSSSIQHMGFYGGFALVLLIYAISYKAISQPDILSLFQNEKERADTPKDINYQAIDSFRKAEEIGVSVNTESLLSKRLKELMEREELYLNEKLSGNELAETLGISRHQLSEVLNNELETNFYKFVNHYRVEACKEKMADSKFGHYTLMAVALECGFNSKTTFNTVFKKETGMTPRQFKKTLQQ
jgi:AraC-like DNA-binding protein